MKTSQKLRPGGPQSLEIYRLHRLCLRHGFLCRWIAHYCPSDAPAQSGGRCNRVFELMVYHAVPGKGPALELLWSRE